jgi:hypothetical protein
MAEYFNDGAADAYMKEYICIDGHTPLVQMQVCTKGARKTAHRSFYPKDQKLKDNSSKPSQPSIIHFNTLGCSYRIPQWLQQ